jgi:addiction module toxin, RelE/StbE family
MTYRLRFHAQALKEWQKLDETIRQVFKKKLAERLQEPRVPSAALFAMPDCYKIKLRKAGYRLIYRVEDNIVYVSVIAVGRRDKGRVYTKASDRLGKEGTKEDDGE